MLTTVPFFKSLIEGVEMKKRKVAVIEDEMINIIFDYLESLGNYEIELY